MELTRAGQHKDALSLYEQTVARFANNDTPEFAALAAAVHFNKGVTLGLLGKVHDELAVYDEIIRHFGSSDAPELMDGVAKALFNKGVTLGKLGRDHDEVEAYDEIVRRFADSDAPSLQESVTKALIIKAQAATDRGKPNTALAICNDILGRISPPNPTAVIALWLRAEALALIHQHTDALCALQTAYEALDPNDGRLIPIASSCISNFVAAGADEGSILRILTSDKERAASLVPLIVALRCRLGEHVRVPTEVEEVAKDIMRYIDEQSNGGAEATTVTER